MLLLAICAFAQASGDPWGRRAARETAVAWAGPGARRFVETEGDAAVAALLAMSPRTGARLAAAWESGALGRLPDKHGFLRCLARPGVRDRQDTVARFALSRLDRLEDQDEFRAFMANPVEQALGLASLEEEAAAERARRLAAERWGAARGWQALCLAAGAGALAGFAAGWWARKRMGG